MSTIKENKLSERRWLVTGGCGFIGKTLVKALIENNEAAYIRIFDNLSVGTRDDLAEYCEFKEFTYEELQKASSKKSKITVVELLVGDIKNAEQAVKACEGIDVVVHLAANTGVGPSVEDSRGDMEANVFGTFNMLEGARHAGVKRFVFASSGAPVGEVEPPIHEELAAHPVSPYGASKLAGEGYCPPYYRTFGVETVALRFGNVYGPGSGHKSSVVAKFIRLAKEGKTLEIYGDGKQTRDFIYIDDLVRAVRLAAKVERAAGETFQIATASETTVGEIVAKMVSIFQENGLHGVDVIYGAERLGDVKRNFSDTSKAASIMGWKANTELEKGLGETYLYLNRKD